MSVPANKIGSLVIKLPTADAFVVSHGAQAAVGHHLGAHCDTDVCQGKGGGIVDPIASHGDDVSLVLQRLYDTVLVLRENFRLDPLDPELVGNGGCGHCRGSSTSMRICSSAPSMSPA